MIQKGHFSKHANFKGVEKYEIAEIFRHITPEVWYPDDYILTSEKSGCSKDRKDAKRLRDHLNQEGLFEKVVQLKSSGFLE